MGVSGLVDGIRLTAAYISFGQFYSCIDMMSQQGVVPNRIDDSILTTHSQSIRRQIITSLKFLYLTNSDRYSTPQLNNLVKSFNTEQWPRALAAVLRDAYAPLLAENLE